MSTQHAANYATRALAIRPCVVYVAMYKEHCGNLGGQRQMRMFRLREENEEEYLREQLVQDPVRRFLLAGC